MSFLSSVSLFLRMCKAWQLGVWLWHDLPLRVLHSQDFCGKKGNSPPGLVLLSPSPFFGFLSLLPSHNLFGRVILRYPYFSPMDPLRSASLEVQCPELDPSETEEDGEVLSHLLPALG